jgi:predicted nucleic acid-binding protein
VKIIVDTNIVFSGVLNTESNIGRILIDSKNYIEFYSINFLKTELFKHRRKLLNLTAVSEEELDELINLITNKIYFIDEEIISPNQIQEASELIYNTDPSDIPFLALTMYLKGKLWTGDKVLIKALRKNGFNDLLNTKEVFEKYNEFGKK